MRALAIPALAVLAATACGDGRQSREPATQGPPAGARSAATPTTVATGLRVPWGIAFLPSGDALVSERTTGRILRIPAGGGRPSVAMRVPGVDTGAGEGGLLGLAVSPGYARDRLVYAYFTSARDNRIVRFRLGGRVRVILRGLASSPIHNGGRIAFGPDRRLYATVGDAGTGSRSQSPRSLNGKILRMNANGTAARGNAFRRSRIWSLGHRNVQGLAWDRSRRLWATEFGGDRFDEVNLIRRGRNYGWPLVEGRGSTRGGRFTNPKVTWRPSQASPAGAAIVRGYLYVGALRGERVWKIRLSGTRAGRPRALFSGRYGRIRTVVRAPDGSIWFTTSNRDGRGSPRAGDDRIMRFRP